MVRSDLDGCGKFIKYSMFFVNFLIFIGGIAVCAIGIWTVVDSSNVAKVMGPSFFTASAGILIAFGGIVAFISFLGCCGAIKEVKCLLATFFIIMFLLAILIALGAIFAFVVKDKLQDELVDALKKTIKEYNEKDDKNPLTESWNEVQQELKCCGASAAKDWSENDAFKDRLPKSCCPGQPATCTLTTDHFKDGCYNSVKDEILKYAKPLSIVGIIVVVIIVLAMVFSCALCLMI